MRKLNLPNQFIFGSKLPQIEMTTEGSRQYTFSKNNFNLFREDSDLDDKGTFTIGSLFKVAENCPYCLRWSNVTLPECETTCEPCSLLAEKYEELKAGHEKIPDGVLNLREVHLFKAPQLHKCKVLSVLLGCTNTTAERKFAEAYYHLAISGMDFPDHDLFCFRDLRKTYGDFLHSWHENLVRSSQKAREPREVIDAILNSLVTPALIPQVWFNYTHMHDQSHQNGVKVPHCVDFIFICENELHVVEIDSPSHYAIQDSAGKWLADEETYTSSLKTERCFHIQGYKVHRFSNYEILNASESELIDLMIDSLGMSPSHFKSKLLALH